MRYTKMLHIPNLKIERHLKEFTKLMQNVSQLNE